MQEIVDRFLTATRYPTISAVWGMVHTHEEPRATGVRRPCDIASETSIAHPAGHGD